jgi:hypothetical protein
MLNDKGLSITMIAYLVRRFHLTLIQLTFVSAIANNGYSSPRRRFLYLSLNNRRLDSGVSRPMIQGRRLGWLGDPRWAQKGINGIPSLNLWSFYHVDRLPKSRKMLLPLFQKIFVSLHGPFLDIETLLGS